MRCKIKQGLKVDTNAKRVIRNVLEFLSKTINVASEITKFPDETERKSPACDALAIVGGRDVAVEHTSVDSYISQREDDDRFRKALGPLVNELEGKLPAPGHYQVCIGINAIPTGVRWDNIRLRISEWVQKVAPALKIGSSFTAPRHFAKEMPEGVPFEVTLYHWPKRDGQFKVARFSPEPEDLEGQRAQVIYEALISRGTKVAKYRTSGFRTILILESKDITLANCPNIGQAFVNAISKCGPSLLPDEVYLVQTEAEPYDFDCLKFEDTLFPNAVIVKEPYTA